jgi:hypothetical protein
MSESMPGNNPSYEDKIRAEAARAGHNLTEADIKVAAEVLAGSEADIHAKAAAAEEANSKLVFDPGSGAMMNPDANLGA